jgi:hypothetical protein
VPVALTIDRRDDRVIWTMGFATLIDRPSAFW